MLLDATDGISGLATVESHGSQGCEIELLDGQDLEADGGGKGIVKGCEGDLRRGRLAYCRFESSQGTSILRARISAPHRSFSFFKNSAKPAASR